MASPDEAGGGANFGAMLEAQLDRAYCVARRVCSSAALADEAVQEAYIRLLKTPPAQRDPEAWPGYILLTVRHTALNLLKSERSRKNREQQSRTENPMRDHPPENSTERAELAAAARSALTQLPDEQREAVALCCELGLSWGEASQILDVPRQTVGDRVNRGLEKLRTVLVSRGYAALAPLVLAQQLQQLGIPHAPAALVQSVSRLTGSAVRKTGANGAAKTVLKAAGRRAVTASAAKSTALAVAVVVTIGSAGTLWVLHQNSAPASATPLLNYDFEDGARPAFLTKGNLVAGPARAGNKFCVEAVPEADQFANRKDVRFDNNGQTLFTLTPDMELSFNCYLDSSLNELTVFVIDRSDHVWKSIKLQMPAAKWQPTTLKFSDIKELKLDRGASVDVEALMFIGFSRQPVTLYIDDVHVLRPAKN